MSPPFPRDDSIAPGLDLAGRGKNTAALAGPGDTGGTAIGQGDRHAAGRRAARTAVALLLLLALTAGAYLAAGPRGFVFDDEKVIVQNGHLRLGLSRAGLAWAFGEFTHANWYPLTWLSHLAAYGAFGLEPAGHHGVNLALHLANTALLAAALASMTGAAGPSLLVAGLFALHPLHVETAAWVTERCGLLSAFFGLLATLAYVAYARRPGPWRALGVALAFGAGLLAKAALVTLPAVFLLLDAWPLGRWRPPPRGAGGVRPWLRGSARLVAEKLPLLALAAAVTAVAFVAQLRGGTVSTLREVPLAARVGNALVAYVAYLGKTFWPRGLAAYYPPPPQPWAPWEVALCGLALAAVTVLCLRRLRSSPWFATGWLWYLVGLLPVIGIVKTGEQVMADRYTYLPLTGVFLALAWEGAAAARRRGAGCRLLAGGGAVAALGALAVVTAGQVRLWRDNATLFAHAAAVTQDNFMAHYQLGWIAATEGRRADAIAHLSETVRIDPGMESARFALAVLLALEGRRAEAEGHYRAAIALEPGHAEAHGNLAALLFDLGRAGEALVEVREALRLAPGDGLAHYNHGLIREHLGDLAGAMASYREALRLKPDFAPARERATALARRLPR